MADGSRLFREKLGVDSLYMEAAGEVPIARFLDEGEDPITVMLRRLPGKGFQVGLEDDVAGEFGTDVIEYTIGNYKFDLCE